MKIDQVDEKWSKKYKKSIDCSNPRGFSQRAHCAGRKKTEAFDNPYKLDYDDEIEGFDQTMSVQLPDKTYLTITFNHEGRNQWVVEFYRGNTQELTGRGNAQRIFATVIDAIQKFIKKEKPASIDFSADKLVKPGQNAESRANLYNSLVKRYASALGYDYKINDQGDQVTYTLKRLQENLKKKKVKELKIVKPDSSSTKGIKRADMPQIANKDYPEFIDYLQDNGAEFTKQTMPAKALKATQGEFSDKGVLKQIQKYIDGAPKKPVIASEDNYIIDGHHRWLVAWNTGDTVEVYKVNMEADELIKLVLKFPKVTFKDIYTEELYDFDKEQPMKSTVAVPGYGTMSIDGLMKNLVQSVTELLGRMKQGTDGMRFADYELNRNKVLTTKLGALIKALDDLQAIRKQGGARSRNIQKESRNDRFYQNVTVPKKNPLAPDDLSDVTAYSKSAKAEYDHYEKELAKDPNKTFTVRIPKVKWGVGENEQQELPIDVNKILGNIQEFESKQYMTAQDADMMRRAIQSLTSGRQTVYPEAILKLLTMVTR